MKVTVGIKALNEERHIEAAVASAVAATAPLGGEVVLADSGSTDRTIEIASRHPIRIVQLENPDERCCGAGAQLAFQHARGEYFYLLDGDMVLDPAFLQAGIAYLESHPDVAAVGGLVQEMNQESEEFQIRARTVAKDRNWLPGIVDRLDCGGLYRSAAVREVGWFADRNLHAFEEFELAARLQARGWKLARIDAPAVEHYGHQTGGYRLLLRRIKSGYSGAPGEVLRGAIGRPHLRVVLAKLAHVRHAVVIIAWWLALLAALASAFRLGWPALAAAAVLLVLPVGFLSWRRGSLKLGLYSMAAWNVSAAGLIIGLLRRRTPPDQPLAARELTSGG